MIFDVKLQPSNSKKCNNPDEKTLTIKLGLAPGDIPYFAKTEINTIKDTLTLFFEYGQKEKTKDIVKENGVIIVYGENSGRIYSIQIPEFKIKLNNYKKITINDNTIKENRKPRFTSNLDTGLSLVNQALKKRNLIYS